MFRSSLCCLPSRLSSCSLPSSFIRFASSHSQKQLSNLAPREIWQYLHSNDNSFIPVIDLAAALYQLSKHPKSSTPQQLPTLLRRIEQSASLLRPRDISNIFVALRRLNISDKQFWKMICEEAKKSCETWNAQQISNTLNALAQSSYIDREFVNSLLKQAITQMNDFTPQGISTTLNAIAKLDTNDKQTLTALCNEIKTKIALFDGQSIACSMNALAKLDQKNLYEGVENKLCQAIAGKTFNSQDLPNLIHAMAKFEMRNRPLIAQLAPQISAQVKSLTAQGISNILYGLAKLNITDHKTLIDQLCIEARNKELKPQEISNIFQALVELKHKDESLFTNLCSQSMKHVKDFNMQDVAHTLDGLTHFEIDNKPLVDKLCAIGRGPGRFSAAEIASTFHALVKNNNKDRAMIDKLTALARNHKDYTLPDLITVLESVLFFKVNDPILLPYLHKLVSKQKLFGVQNTVSMLKILSKREIADEVLFGTLIKQVYRAAIRLQELKIHHLVDMLIAMGELHQSFPNEPLVHHIIEKIRANLTEMDGKQLALTLNALSQLRSKDISLLTRVIHLLRFKSNFPSDSFLLSRSLLAVANLNVYDNELFNAMRQRALHLVKNLNQNEIADIFDALGKASVNDEKLIARMCEKAYEFKFTPPDAVRILHALGRLNNYNEVLCSKLCTRIINQTQELNISQVIDLLHALVILPHVDVKLVKVLRRRFLTENFELRTLEELEVLSQCQLVFRQEPRWQGELHGSCDRVFAERLTRRPRRSKLLASVSETLRSMSVEHSVQLVLPAGPVVDVALEDNQAGLIVAGPTAMVRGGGKPLGQTALRQRILQGLGWKVSLVSFDVWDNLKEPDRKLLLQKLLNLPEEKVSERVENTLPEDQVSEPVENTSSEEQVSSERVENTSPKEHVSEPVEKAEQVSERVEKEEQVSERDGKDKQVSERVEKDEQVSERVGKDEQVSEHVEQVSEHVEKEEQVSERVQKDERASERVEKEEPASERVENTSPKEQVSERVETDEQVSERVGKVEQVSERENNLPEEWVSERPV